MKNRKCSLDSRVPEGNPVDWESVPWCVRVGFVEKVDFEPEVKQIRNNGWRKWWLDCPMDSNLTALTDSVYYSTVFFCFSFFVLLLFIIVLLFLLMDKLKQNKKDESPTERVSVSAIRHNLATSGVTLVCRCLHPFCGWRHLATSRESKAHFGLPWVAPGTNAVNVTCVEKRIQWRSNSSQHVPIYLQPFTSYSEIGLLVGNCNFFPYPPRT